ncbi:MAG: decarboxylating NADP(+)-dependent phosphogluconate dehydrogenase [Spirochaetes bacterium]|nr:decarboxylating NADP(+)-dependent phosphogluconate dehydrogenase [Spirochaetota bacterium]
MVNKKANIGFIGLGVMGQNLVLNLNEQGHRVAALNLVGANAVELLKKKTDTIYTVQTIEEMIQLLESPHIIMLMIKAGQAIDDTIDKLLPYLKKGDVIIDGGNSHYQDSNRRTLALEERGIYFVGAGISGGEEGARYGASIMVGGNLKGWPLVKTILQSIAARTAAGEICCDWVGENGAGHYVKMVHNGIEYGDMQIIAETYQLLKSLGGLSPHELQNTFFQWNQGELNSYLIEITAHILNARDEDGLPLVEKIKDTAEQKGTGKWTGISSLELGVPVTLIAEAVFARSLSFLKGERVKASQLLEGPKGETIVNKEELIAELQQALLAAKIISYAQGYMLFKQAAGNFNWQLDYAQIARLWQGGCIIRSVFLDKIKKAYEQNPELENLMLDSYFHEVLNDCQHSLRKVVIRAASAGIPVPAISSALAFYDGYRSSYLWANLLQAQRDYFGSHTYEKLEEPGKYYHTNWSKYGNSFQ